MSDLMREEFEKIAAEKFCVDLKVIQDSRTDEGFDGFPYRVINQHGDQSENVNSLLGVALLFWQASRECLVIEPEWPDHYSYTKPDCAGAAILDCRSAFNVSARAAGVKTK